MKLIKLPIAMPRAAFDISLPAHTGAAFAKKADWFRLLAHVDEKREQAVRNHRADCWRLSMQGTLSGKFSGYTRPVTRTHTNAWKTFLALVIARRFRL